MRRRSILEKLRKVSENQNALRHCEVCGGVFDKRFMKQVYLVAIHRNLEKLSDTRVIYYCRQHMPSYDIEIYPCNRCGVKPIRLAWSDRCDEVGCCEWKVIDHKS